MQIKAATNPLMYQVASIEPSEDIPAWTAPELIVNYPGALSPIMEETGNQLSAYENDRICKLSIYYTLHMHTRFQAGLIWRNGLFKIQNT